VMDDHEAVASLREFVAPPEVHDLPRRSGSRGRDRRSGLRTLLWRGRLESEHTIRRCHTRSRPTVVPRCMGCIGTFRDGLDGGRGARACLPCDARPR
jgi:hypothetical protein